METLFKSLKGFLNISRATIYSWLKENKILKDGVDERI